MALAIEFLENKYPDKPAPEMRSFADHLRHIAFWNNYVEKTLRREAVDGSANELPPERDDTKDKIADALKTSFAAVKTELENGALRDSSALDTIFAFVEHNGEHYGQLVVYYRLNGLVPPASR